MLTRFLSLICLAFLLTAAPACSGYGPAHSAGAQLGFGVAMAKRGLWNEALFRFEQARRLDPGNPQVINNLAVASEATGRFEEALELYREALRLAPNDKELRRNFSRFIEFYQGLQPEGEETTEEAGTATDPESTGEDEGAEGAVSETVPEEGA